MSYEVDFSREHSVLTLGGELTLVNVAALKSVLQECLDEKAELHVRFRNVVRADLSFLQILCAAHRSAVAMNKGFTTDVRKDEHLTEMIHRAGFVRHRGCQNDIHMNCLWTRGDA